MLSLSEYQRTQLNNLLQGEVGWEIEAYRSIVGKQYICIDVSGCDVIFSEDDALWDELVAILGPTI